MNAVTRVALLVLGLLIIGSLFLSYVNAIDYSNKDAEVTLAYSGIDMLLGRTTGKSADTLNPMLLLTVFCAVLYLIGLVRGTKNTTSPVLWSALALAALLFFLFDAHFADKREFNFAVGTTIPQLGWWIGVIAAAVALVVSVSNKIHISASISHNQRIAIYENRELPAGYKDPTLWEIIKRDFHKHWPIYLMLVPLLVYYCVWCYGPMYGIVIAFNEYKPKRGFLGSEWVGLQWYREFFRSAFAWRTIRNTLFISLLDLFIGFPAPIILALMLNEMRSEGYKRVVQTITYIPHFISVVVMSGILLDFFSTEGVVTTVLNKVFGLPLVNYFGDARYFRTLYVGSNIWQQIGWNSIIYLSALAGIDMELYEAARIDGAGRFKQTWHITLPGIAPTITILLILRVGQLLSVGYEKIILLYNAMTYETADVISSYVYRVGIQDMQFSRSTAINTLNSIVNFILVIMANKISATLTETSLW